MIDILVQVAIVILGALAISLLASAKGQVRRWGYVAGLVSEPFWIWSAYFADQFGVIALAVWWGYHYYRGAVNNWRAT